MRKFSIGVLLQDNCINRKISYSIDDVLIYGDIEKFIKQASKEEPVYYETAYKLLLEERKRKILDELKALKKLTNVEVGIKFITPFGLIKENDFMIPYKECIQSIGKQRLMYLFQESNLEDDLFNFIAQESNLVNIMVINRRILQLLQLEDMFNDKSLYILILDKPYYVKKDNVISIFPNQYMISKIREVIPKTRFERFVPDVLYLLVRFLRTILVNRLAEKIHTLGIKGIEEIIDIIRTYSKQTKKISSIIEDGEEIPKYIILEIPKVQLRVREKSVKSNTVQTELVEMNFTEMSLRLSKILTSQGRSSRVIFIIGKGFKDFFDRYLREKYGDIDYEKILIEAIHPFSIQFLDNGKRIHVETSFDTSLSSVEYKFLGDELIILSPIRALSLNQGMKGIYVIRWDEMGKLLELDCSGDTLVIVLNEDVVDETTEELNDLRTKFDTVVLYKKKSKNIQIWGSSSIKKVHIGGDPRNMSLEEVLVKLILAIGEKKDL